MNVPNLPPEGKPIEDWRAGFLKLLPITLRVLNDFDYRTLKNQIRREDGWKDLQPQYVNP